MRDRETARAVAGPGILIRTLRPGDENTSPRNGDTCLVGFYLEEK